MPTPGVCQNIMNARDKHKLKDHGTFNNPERYLNQDYKKLIKEYGTGNYRFRDDKFCADINSIGEGILNPSDLAKVQWLRPDVSNHH